MSFYPNAQWQPGPSQKQGYPGTAVNARRGVVCHSMVGYYAGALAELTKLERRASWHFSVLQSGLVIQHYDTRAVCWHAGSPKANGQYIGIEHEGGYNPTNEPLTARQLQASVALVRWLSLTEGFPLERQVSLWEHNELAPPTDPTSCPSHRIPWDAYTEDHMPTPEYDELKTTIDATKATLLKHAIENSQTLQAFGAAFFDLARHVYGDADPRTLDIEQRLKALESDK